MSKTNLEKLIKAAWRSSKSINSLAKEFGVKPVEVREAFDIALARRRENPMTAEQKARHNPKPKKQQGEKNDR